MCVCVCAHALFYTTIVMVSSQWYRKDPVTLCEMAFSDAIELTEFLDLMMIDKGDRNEEVL